ncbi:MAG TPA: ACP phosphodiesterase [Flavipsychrobacter sp.]|nr:ACP phosphodiesterase [Flavipsychrobacter sp.]
MNYLGHAFLSMGDEELLTGNMIGDYVKGKIALDDYPPGIKRGLILHRRIDSFTDSHAAVARAKNYFREKYELYAGAVVDIVFDHFLANDPKHFISEKALWDFTQQTYATLEKNSTYFPEKYSMIFPYMKSHNWLYGYRTLKGIQKSLDGLQRRAKYMPDAENAYKTLVGHYYLLSQCYYDFIDDASRFVKVTLTEGDNF